MVDFCFARTILWMKGDIKMLEAIPSPEEMAQLIGENRLQLWYKLCAMVIFGKAERDKFEQNRNHFSLEEQNVYDAAKTYHDGIWMMFFMEDTNLFEDVTQLLAIKRRPNRK